MAGLKPRPFNARSRVASFLRIGNVPSIPEFLPGYRPKTGRGTWGTGQFGKIVATPQNTTDLNC